MYFLQLFGVCAYVACVLLWLVVLLPFGPSIVESDVFEAFVPSTHEQAVEPTTVSQPNPVVQVVLFAVVAALVIAMIIFTIISLRKAPRAIGQTGQKMTHRAAETVVAVVPALTHRHMSSRVRKKLTTRIVFYIKLAIICVPLLVAVCTPMPDSFQLTKELQLVVVAVLASWALLLFSLQLIFARLLHVSYDTLW